MGIEIYFYHSFCIHQHSSFIAEPLNIWNDNWKLILTTQDVRNSQSGIIQKQKAVHTPTRVQTKDQHMRYQSQHGKSKANYSIEWNWASHSAVYSQWNMEISRTYEISREYIRREHSVCRFECAESLLFTFGHNNSFICCMSCGSNNAK